ncbi:MAG: preprotein translocase subunit SecA [Candidatus Kerfeldbacteria bacterium]|nr:preprotein translocase subunit SecA [Candidatus Kerfeldbacteria bacterium]
MSMLSKIFGDANHRAVKAHDSLLAAINGHKELLAAWPMERFAARAMEIRQSVNGDPAKLEAHLPEVFAMVREVSKRTIHLEHFDVQLLGGIVLHRGGIAEMRTGEGKTLVATSAVVLNALTGKGVHLVTVNDYLARRDAGWMGAIYHTLGLSVGVIVHEQAYQFDPDYTDPAALEERTAHLRPIERRQAYESDIVYGTNNEFGFDYLRDNMVPDRRYLVQRSFYFAIIDEVDSILIDEARTPLIISAPAEESSERYQRFVDIVERLEDVTDYVIDEKMRTASLSESGIAKVEKMLGLNNLYAAGGIEMVHHLEQALKAKTLFTLDRDYVVKDGEVVIVDEFTGRLMFGRRYSEGLHQAIEAKERLEIKQESQTLATVTLQNLFRLYPKLAGMTGTAATEAEEFHKIYNLDVTVIPTNRDMIRKDLPDSVYKNESGKFSAVAREIKRRHEAGQPILVGTISIEKNEALSELLKSEGVPHEILNAKNHEREAQIIAQAGRPGAVTLATNIAGRGVDILLGGAEPEPEAAEKVKQAGGLHVLGTERHEARRIDNQLRGRSGRQGDPGSTQFFVSMDDDLLRIFGSERMKGLMDRMGVPDDMPIESGIVSKSIEQAQKKVEGHNFDIRKHLVEYDDVINKHREVIYKRRREILFAPQPGVTTRATEVIAKEIDQIVSFHTAADSRPQWDLDAIYSAAEAMGLAGIKDRLQMEDVRQASNDPGQDAAARTNISQMLMKHAEEHLVKIGQQVSDPTVWPEVLRNVMLRTIDQLWIEHLDLMDRLREGIGLRGYGQRDPLIEYKKEAFDLFSQLINSINAQIANTVFKITVEPSANVPAAQPRQQLVTSAPQKEAVEARDRGPLIKPKMSAGGVDLSNVGRNDPCPCGSGKKFKKCYVANDPGCKLLFPKP